MHTVDNVAARGDGGLGHIVLPLLFVLAVGLRHVHVLAKERQRGLLAHILGRLLALKRHEAISVGWQGAARGVCKQDGLEHPLQQAATSIRELSH